MEYPNTTEDDNVFDLEKFKKVSFLFYCWPTIKVFNAFSFFFPLKKNK